jgi:hypothetical protein
MDGAKYRIRTKEEQKKNHDCNDFLVSEDTLDVASGDA